ncbi:hypothetical protein C8F04DRAFT_1276136 [Mycena alexandri]|uniref:Uncharacterized protein n=1 Tax=Mycena alexandri TaxID=1745969 RepID=A0AAD6WQ39_9AGAR|nr:hypothetical protein C8F04DRAFT_1276136 [Mycena alexandri]
MPPGLTPDICWQIAKFTPDAALLDLLLLSKRVYPLILPLIYNYVDVGVHASDFVNSLANNKDLPPLVRGLEFAEAYSDSTAPLVDATQWALVLPAMKNLKLLYITRGIDFSLDVLPRITFNLTTFGSRFAVIGAWATFVASQPSLDELKLNCDYYGDPPTLNQLPVLRAVKGRPADLARFARIHYLYDMWFYSGPPHGRHGIKAADLALFAVSPSRLWTIRLTASQFLLLMKHAPNMISTLRHIIFDEEVDWTEFTRESLAVVRGPLATIAKTLNKYTPFLVSLLLAFSQNVTKRNPFYRPLLHADGEFFLNSFKAICPTPHFNTFRVYAADGTTTWKDWGSTKEEVSYLPPPPERGPIELERAYQSLFVSWDRPPEARCVYLKINNFKSSTTLIPPSTAPERTQGCALIRVSTPRGIMQSTVAKTGDVCFMCIRDEHENRMQYYLRLFLEHPQRTMHHHPQKKKKRHSLLPRPKLPPPIPPEEPRRLKRRSVPTPQELESARQAEHLSAEGEACWQAAFAVLPDIVHQWAAGTLPTGDDSDDAEDPEIHGLPHITSLSPDLPDILFTSEAERTRYEANHEALWRQQEDRREHRGEHAAGRACEASAERRQRLMVDGEAPVTRSLRYADRWTAERRAFHATWVRAELNGQRERRRQAREWEREREALLPGLRQTIVDGMRPWERQEFLRVELEQEERQFPAGRRHRLFDDLDTVDYVN